MKLSTTLFAVVVSLAFPAAQFLSADENLEPLIRSLVHPDKQIREAANNLLLDDETEATTPLVNGVLNPANSEKLSSVCAIVLIERLSLLKGRWNRTDKTKPVIDLTDDDKQQLRPLVEYVGSSVGEVNWRWYLAVSILAELDAKSLLEVMPALTIAIQSNDQMLQYGATKAVFHNSKQPETHVTKSALLDLLYRPRAPFQGVYLRGNRLIDENRIAYTNDVRVYADVDTGDSYERLNRYYGHGDVLISDTLLALGATYDEIGPMLSFLAARDASSFRLRAIRQLVQLGPSGQREAAVNLRHLLLEQDKYLIRTLADEHPSLVGNVPLEDPTENLKVIRVFSELGESTKLVVVPLSGLLHNGDDRVRHVAANILGRIGSQDMSAALNELQVALAPAVIAPLTDLAKNEDARKIMEEIANQNKVVSLDLLQSISDELVFDNPLRPSQEECFRAMLEAALKLQSARNKADDE